MSASRMPTLRPRALRPSARLTAVVDLPTPPLPEATAMIASTPGIPCTASPRAAGRPPAGAPCAGRGDGAPALRSAVKATRADCTPGSARTASSAHLRTGSHILTAAASTLIEKNTLPSPATTSDSVPLLGNGTPSGDLTPASAASTCSFETAILLNTLPSSSATRRHAGWNGPTRWLTSAPARRNHTGYRDRRAGVAVRQTDPIGVAPKHQVV